MLGCCLEQPGSPLKHLYQAHQRGRGIPGPECSMEMPRALPPAPRAVNDTEPHSDITSNPPQIPSTSPKLSQATTLWDWCGGVLHPSTFNPSYLVPVSFPTFPSICFPLLKPTKTSQTFAVEYVRIQKVAKMIQKRIFSPSIIRALSSLST